MQRRAPSRVSVPVLLGLIALSGSSCSLLIGDLPEPLGEGAGGTRAEAGGAAGDDERGEGGVALGATGAASGRSGAGRDGGSSFGGTAGMRSSGGSGGSLGGTAGEGAAGQGAGATAADGGAGERGGTGGASAGTGGSTGGTEPLGGKTSSGGASGNGGGAGKGGPGGKGGRASSGGTGGSTGGIGGTGGTSGTAGSTSGTGGSTGGTGGMAVDCDADDDGFLAENEACGGDDCDDADEDAHPGQADFFISPRASGGYDYDCDGTAEPEVTDPLDCSLLLDTDCNGEGYSGSLPDCGEPGAWIQCAPTLLPLSLVCEPEADGTREMGCR